MPTKETEDKAAGLRNIIWIIVDSVRNYTCPADRVDDRGRIELMNELAEDWIDCRTVVTSAPSTVMSISAMLTSCPAYYLGSNFAGIRLDNSCQPNVATILTPHGYQTYCITLGPNEREAWDSVLGVIPRRLWPPKARHRYEWNNDLINQALENQVRDGLKEPFFFLLHYNCRGDEHISENVQKGLDCLGQAGWMDDSVVLLTSDHGYPDPLRKQAVAERRAEAALKHRESAHDLVLTDDNVLVPLLVRYPGFTPRTIDQQICTLDYLPTSLDLAGIKTIPPLHGKSVVPLLEGGSMPELEDRLVRIDGRFVGQTGRCTAIRSQDCKYVVYPDRAHEDREQFFDLTKDTLEIDDLFLHDSGDYISEIDRFKKSYQEDEGRCREVQLSFMKELYSREWDALFPGVRAATCSHAVYLPSGRVGFDELFEEVLKLHHGEDSVTVGESAPRSNGRQRAYDVAIAGVARWKHGQLKCNALARIGASKKLLVNLNINLMRYSRAYVVSLLSKDWKLHRQYYLREPLYWLHAMTHKS